MNAATHAVPAPVGAAFGGGILAGRYFVGDAAFALVVAPKAGGERKAGPWGELVDVPAAIDPEDGRANTAAMSAAGNALGCWARDLRIAGHDDWYLPSRLELFMAWLGLRDTKEFVHDWYWTSTQYASDPDSAWIQNFTSGTQDYHLKVNHCRARAVRRVPIQSFANSIISEAA